jgi:hypothetical protein
MRRTVLSLAAAALLAAAAPAAAEAAPSKSCASGASVGHLGVVAVGPTSCAFARDTLAKWWRVAPTVEYSWGYGLAARTVRVRSRTTGRYYTMRCRMISTQDSPYGRCTGGNGADARLYS